MKIATRDAKILAEALRALHSGNGNRFDDILWLNLGDGCAAAYKLLISHKCIENPNDLQAIRLTGRGVDLLRRLTESVLMVA